MIIPIRCMGCGKVIADKWRYFQEELKKLKKGDFFIIRQSFFIEGLFLIVLKYQELFKVFFQRSGFDWPEKVLTQIGLIA